MSDIPDLFGAREPEKVAAEVVEPELVDPQTEIRAISDRIAADAAEIVGGAMRFTDLSAEEIGSDEPPEEWVREMGRKEALRAFRAAKAALCSSKDAPIGLKMASQVLVGAMRANAQREAVPRINISFVELTAGGGVEYPVQEVED